MDWFKITKHTIEAECLKCGAKVMQSEKVNTFANFTITLNYVFAAVCENCFAKEK